MQYYKPNIPLSYGVKWAGTGLPLSGKRLGVVLQVFPPDHQDNYSKAYTECSVLIRRPFIVLRHVVAPIFYINQDARVEWIPRPSSNVDVRGNVVYYNGKPVVDPAMLDGSWVIVDFVDGIAYIEREFPRPRQPYKNKRILEGENLRIVYRGAEIVFTDDEIRIKVGDGMKIRLGSDDASQPFVKGNTLTSILEEIKNMYNGHTHPSSGSMPDSNHLLNYTPGDVKSSKIFGE